MTKAHVQVYVEKKKASFYDRNKVLIKRFSLLLKNRIIIFFGKFIVSTCLLVYRLYRDLKVVIGIG